MNEKSDSEGGEDEDEDLDATGMTDGQVRQVLEDEVTVYSDLADICSDACGRLPKMQVGYSMMTWMLRWPVCDPALAIVLQVRRFRALSLRSLKGYLISWSMETMTKETLTMMRRS